MRMLIPRTDTDWRRTGAGPVYPLVPPGILLVQDHPIGNAMYENPNDVRHDDQIIRAAIRFSTLTAVLGIGFLIAASVWVSTCGGSTADTVACGAPQRTVLALGAPAILLFGALWAFIRTYQRWQTNQTWVPWQGAGWFLMTLMLIVLTMSLTPLIGPTFN